MSNIVSLRGKMPGGLEDDIPLAVLEQTFATVDDLPGAVIKPGTAMTGDFGFNNDVLHVVFREVGVFSPPLIRVQDGIEPGAASRYEEDWAQNICTFRCATSVGAQATLTLPDTLGIITLVYNDYGVAGNEYSLTMQTNYQSDPIFGTQVIVPSATMRAEWIGNVIYLTLCTDAGTCAELTLMESADPTVGFTISATPAAAGAWVNGLLKARVLIGEPGGGLYALSYYLEDCLMVTVYLGADPDDGFASSANNGDVVNEINSALQNSTGVSFPDMTQYFVATAVGTGNFTTSQVAVAASGGVDPAYDVVANSAGSIASELGILDNIASATCTNPAGVVEIGDAINFTGGGADFTTTSIVNDLCTALNHGTLTTASVTSGSGEELLFASDNALIGGSYACPALKIWNEETQVFQYLTAFGALGEEVFSFTNM